MATIKLDNKRARQFGGAVPFGNVTNLVYGFETNSSGVVLYSDDTTQLVQNDVIDLGLLPNGFRLDDASIIVQNATNANVVCKLGFKYADGVDVTAVPQDDDYFGASLALSSAGRVRANAGNLVTLPKDARLIMTVSGADVNEAAKVSVIVTGELTGPK